MMSCALMARAAAARVRKSLENIFKSTDVGGHKVEVEVVGERGWGLSFD